MTETEGLVLVAGMTILAIVVIATGAFVVIRRELQPKMKTQADLRTNDTPGRFEWRYSVTKNYGPRSQTLSWGHCGYAPEHDAHDHVSELLGEYRCTGDPKDVHRINTEMRGEFSTEWLSRTDHADE